MSLLRQRPSLTKADRLMNEDDLIARYFAPLAGAEGLGLLDDAALVSVPSGQDLVITCDALVAGVHFFEHDPADAVAAKALRVNLSDLAAKGATPRGFVVTLALNSFDEAWLQAFSRGLKADIGTFAFPLLGGDTVKTPGPVMISVTAFGLVPQGQMVPRTGARAGDALYVSGTIGDAALGLLERQGTISAGQGGAHLVARYLVPEPRNGLSAALRAHAHAAMDVSDGLIGDLSKMMRVSGVTAEVHLSDVPLSAGARAVIGEDEALFASALAGGDDYEILAAVAPDQVQAFEQAALLAGVPVTQIGRVEAGHAPPRFLNQSGAPVTFSKGSFSHF